MAPLRFIILTALLISVGFLPASSPRPAPFLKCPASASRAAPVAATAPGEELSFCGGYTGAVSCCDAADDAKLREQFDNMNITDDDACAATIKEALCMMWCTPSLSTEINNVQSAADIARSLPHLLCGSFSAPSSSSSSSTHRRLNTQLGMCLEKLSTDSFLNMAAHPDGSSDRAFLSTQDGRIWLARVPAHGSALHIHYETRPFLDLTDRLGYGDDDDNDRAALGLRGVVFHPEFSTNGRFFVAYTCDSALPACGGDCWVPAAGSGLRPCRDQLVVAEYRARSARGGGVDYSKEPYEVRRVFSIGVSEPYIHHSYRHHEGELLFKLSGGYLYLILGEEFVSSNNKKPVGKIIRFDVDGSTPKAEVYALGLANPSGCSFDSERPFMHLYCANVDQRQYEQVYLIYETDERTAKKQYRSVSLVVSHGRSRIDRMPSIVGGIVYRGSAVPFLVGSYMYMYGSAAWVAVESNEGNYTSTQIPNIRCSRSTPLACSRGIDGRVLSFGEDNNKDAFLLTTGGVYRVVHPDLCEQGTPPSPPQLPLPLLVCLAVALMYVFYRIYWTICPGIGGGAVITFLSGCCSNWFVTNYNYNTGTQHHES